ncbi:hypothetical protein EYC79_05665 [Agrobacterium cavarae]|uniref:CD-NTase-associated protein 12/Pycsar effector protein TIR domain-containing protein n=1 Tax=Agrobacterium cavarae TaxID=2528239 RepID=A0ABY1YDJ2_9HYPH|nr:hypothetical protein EYC79_05665 [Agrobacterium cavarae]
MLPRVFIGSSREGLPIANAIHTNLTYDAECTVWDKGLTKLTAYTLSEIIQNLRKSDFGIFVLSPDDVATIRGQKNLVARDNVIFELGLFIGRLGPERCFFLMPRGQDDLHLPSDLAGLNAGQYENRQDGNLLAAVSPVCVQISQQMKELKSFQDAASQVKPTAANATNVLSANVTPVKPTITAETYKNGILIKGDTKPFKEELKGLGGRWNGALAGWIISPKRFAEACTLMPLMEDKTGNND